MAGAGSGKTSTIVGKIGYLTKKGIKPEELLAITFANNAKKEMSDRVEALFGSQYNIKTFHKLGKDIIQEVEGKAPSISDLVSDFNNYKLPKKIEEFIKDRIYIDKNNDELSINQITLEEYMIDTKNKRDNINDIDFYNKLYN